MSVHAFYPPPYLVLNTRVLGLVLGQFVLHERVVGRHLLLGRLGYLVLTRGGVRLVAPVSD